MSHTVAYTNDNSWNAWSGHFDRLGERALRCRQDRKFVIGSQILAALILLAGGFDIMSTNAALAVGLVEGNPIVAGVQELLGFWWWVPKMAGHLALAMLILWLPSKQMLGMASFMIVGYAGIVSNNFYLTSLVA
jgi:hypothetical protein